MTTFTAADGTKFEMIEDGQVIVDYRLRVSLNDLLEFAAQVIKQNQLAKLEALTWHEVIGGLGK